MGERHRGGCGESEPMADAEGVSTPFRGFQAHQTGALAFAKARQGRSVGGGYKRGGVRRTQGPVGPLPRLLTELTCRLDLAW